MKRILLVEPQLRERRRLSASLGAAVEVEAIDDLPHRECANLADFDAVVANARLPSGVDPLLSCGGAPVVLLDADPTVAAAVSAVRRGAADYLAQPVAGEALREAVQGALARAAAAGAEPGVGGDGGAARREAGSPAPSTAPAEGARWPLYGGCAAMLELFERIRAAAGTNAPVLIEGESGTGKVLVAHALYAAGPSNAPMTTLDCAAVPEALIESELFGFAHAGAPGPSAMGLVHAARGGTLFINEVGDLPASAQARLVELLREGVARPVNGAPRRCVDVRVVAATARDVEQLARDGRFRGDLLTALRCARLLVPPLRERGDDVARLAEFLAGRAAARLNKPLLRFSPAALAAICAYRWPGNVRELENAIERAAILCEGDEIDMGLLAIDVGKAEVAGTPLDVENGVSLEDYFVRFVVENQDQLTETELAMSLGISRKSLWERRKRHGIPRRRTRKRGPRRGAA